jgi:putative phosphoesterase
MRVAALYDIHGNLPALEAVLDEVRRIGVDRIVVGGDVLPGPMPSETLTRLLDLDLPIQFIRGNGDRVVHELMTGNDSHEFPESFREAMLWNARQLHMHESLLASWPAMLRVDVPGIGRVLCCHATPRNDLDIFTRLTPEADLLPLFDGLQVPLVVCGHTHMQFDRTIGGIRVVNAGSVGMPFQAPGAYWLLLGPGVELRHTPYDLDAAATRIRATDYPGAEQFAAHNVLQTPSEQAMLEMFTGASVKVTHGAES